MTLLFFSPIKYQIGILSIETRSVTSQSDKKKSNDNLIRSRLISGDLSNRSIRKSLPSRVKAHFSKIDRINILFWPRAFHVYAIHSYAFSDSRSPVKKYTQEFPNLPSADEGRNPYPLQSYASVRFCLRLHPPRSRPGTSRTATSLFLASLAADRDSAAIRSDLYPPL